MESLCPIVAAKIFPVFSVSNSCCECDMVLQQFVLLYTLIMNYVIFQVVDGVAKIEVSANISGEVSVGMLIRVHIYIQG